MNKDIDGLKNSDSGEIWADIVGFEGLYEVSTFGRVIGLKYGIIRKTKISNKGYCSIRLSKNGKPKYCSMHRLVAEAFIPRVIGKDMVNHIDGNKLNNYVDNLEWVTNSENMKHAYKIGLLNINSTSKPVNMIKDGIVLQSFKSISEAKRQTDIQHGCISKCCLGKRIMAGGYSWEFQKIAKILNAFVVPPDTITILSEEN